jgi:hypothetical protein
MQRHFRSVDGPRVSGRVCGKHVKPQKSWGDLLLWRRPARACVLARAGFTEPVAQAPGRGAYRERTKQLGMPRAIGADRLRRFDF